MFLILQALLMWVCGLVGYNMCKGEFVKTQQAQYEATIEKLIAAKNEVAAKAAAYRAAADAVRLDAERLRSELNTASPSTRDKPTTTSANTSGRPETMALVLERATNLIEERDTIALQYNELREQCQLK